MNSKKHLFASSFLATVGFGVLLMSDTTLQRVAGTILLIWAIFKYRDYEGYTP